MSVSESPDIASGEPATVIETHLASGVRVLSTTRRGGVSSGRYSSWNLGAHVGDDPSAVRANRQRLGALLPASTQICWLNQVHGTLVVPASTGSGAEADAVWLDTLGIAGAVMTADCLPVVLAAKEGGCAAVAHAGWRGLAAGVIAETVKALPVQTEGLSAWLGPAIGPAAFEVGDEVRQAFISAQGDAAQHAFLPGSIPGKWLCDLYELARQQLAALGIEDISGGDRCTFTESEDFFSYRRDGRTGRMATVVWLER